MSQNTLSICVCPFLWSFPSQESLSRTIKRQDLWLQRLKRGGNCLKGFHCDDDLSKILQSILLRGKHLGIYKYSSICSNQKLDKIAQKVDKSCIGKWLCNWDNWEMYEQSMFINEESFHNPRTSESIKDFLNRNGLYQSSYQTMQWAQSQDKGSWSRYGTENHIPWDIW